MTEVATRRKPRSKRPDGTEYSSDPKERHAQLVADGKLGAKGSELAKEHGKRGGRPRKPRAAELIAEKARQEAEKLWSAYEAGLDEEQPVRVRMEAAGAVLDIERREAQQQLEEDKFDQMSDQELEDEFERLTNSAFTRSALGEPVAA